jgi:2-isopropylmalate synthase
MRRELGRVINNLADSKGLEITPEEVYATFQKEFIDRESPYKLLSFNAETAEAHKVFCRTYVEFDGETKSLEGHGNGPIDAFVRALIEAGVEPFEIISYSEHSVGTGADSSAAAYIQIKTQSGFTGYGAGLDTSIDLASIKGVLSALNRAAAKKA